MNNFLQILILSLCIFTIYGAKLSTKFKLPTKIKVQERSNSSFILPNNRDNNGINTRIVNGQEAVPHAYPWQVGIVAVDYAGYEYFCGGSLVARDMVLTAGHCVDGMVGTAMAFGVHDLESSVEDVQIISSTTFIIHKNYDINIFLNDIALIKLDDKVTLNDNVKIIVLDNSTYIDETHAGQTALVSGWGITRGGQTSQEAKLRYVENEVMSNDDCKNSNAELKQIIKDSHICFSNKDGKGVCSGDSGGPMVYDDRLIGFVSFGPTNCKSDVLPSGFTRISAYREWIETNCPDCNFSGAEITQYTIPLYLLLSFYIIRNLIF